MTQIWSKAQLDIDRILEIWEHCLHTYKGPFLFGKLPCMADAMYAPVCTRFTTYDVKLDAACQAYCDVMLKFPAMVEWAHAARTEPDDVEELDVEF